MKNLIDVHAHLDFPDFEKDLDTVIQRAKDSGVVRIITAGIDTEKNRRSLEIAKKYPIIDCSLGIYPPDALKKESEQLGFPYKKPDIEKEIQFIRENKEKIVAIGEIGMDYINCSEQEKQKQQELFNTMLSLAKELNLPVIVHSRKAEADVINILEQNNQKKVLLHCFSGKKSLSTKAAELGYHFSIPTNIVRAENFQGLVNRVNLKHLLTETDAPFLSPYKGQRNEPANVTETIKKIAEIKQLEIQEAANIIYMNYQRLFSK